MLLIPQGHKFGNHWLTALFCRTAFEPEEDNRARLPPRTLSPIKQEPSTSTAPQDNKSSAAPQVTKSSAAPEVPKSSAAPQVPESTPSSKKKTARKKSPVPKPKKEKSAPFLTKAFFNTVAPGLASFAQTQKSDLHIIVEEEEEVEEDPDVIAMMADFWAPGYYCFFTLLGDHPMTHSNSQYLKAIRLALFSISNTYLYVCIFNFPKRIVCGYLIILLHVRELFSSSPCIAHRYPTVTKPEV